MNHFRFPLAWSSALIVLLSLPSCALLKNATKDDGPKVAKAYKVFLGREDYPKTMEVYQDPKLLEKAEVTDTRVKVDLSDQRTQLFINGQVALDSPCCTGKAGKRTPAGVFPIKEKIKDKRSNIFGSIYKGKRKVFGGDRRKYKGGGRYVGSPLPYWMRLTDGGIGLHASKYVHRFPKSNGCIRMPHAAVATVFSKVSPGTKVEVVQ